MPYPQRHTEPGSAADWRAVQAALLVDVRAWTALADEVQIQPGLPRLLAADYAIEVGRGYRQMARAAQTAADQAKVIADELEAARRVPA